MNKLVRIPSLLAPMLCGSFLGANGQQNTVRPPVSLRTAHVASGGVAWTDAPDTLVLHSVIFDFGIRSSSDSDGNWVVYDLQKKYVDFVFGVGFITGNPIEKEHTPRVQISIDGDVVFDREVDPLAKPYRSVLHIKGHRSLRIVVGGGAGIAEPTLYSERYKGLDGTEGGGPGPEPVNTKAFVEDGKLKLRWPEVVDASSYSIVLYYTGSQPGVDGQRVWSYMREDRDEIDLSLEHFPQGSYELDIQAFNAKGKLGSRIVGKPFRVGA